MSSGEDLRSHRLAHQRLVSAFVGRDSDPARYRGTATAALVGVLVTALAVGAVAAWQQWADQGIDDWQRPGVVVMEAESGARHLWRDGLLHPVANYTSAQLILGEPAPPTVTVPADRLRGAPQGAPLGMVGLPDRVPPAAQLATGPWTVCSVSDGAGAPSALLTVGADAVLDGVTPRRSEAVLVADSDGGLHLWWRQRRHRLRDPQLVRAALGWQLARPVPVAPAVLAAMPAGADLAPAPLPGRGEPSATVPGATVGEIFMVPARAGEPQYAVAVRDGLAVLTPLLVDLMLADQGAGAGADPGAGAEPDPGAGADPGAAPRGRELRRLAPAEVAALPRSAETLVAPDLPATVPPLVKPAGPAQAVCVVAEGESAGQLRLDPVLPPPPARVATGPGPPDGIVIDELVLAGPAALASAGDTVWLVSAAGSRHAVADDALVSLGLAGAVVSSVPAPLVSCLPEGPALDPSTVAAPGAERAAGELSTGGGSALPTPPGGG